MVIESNNFDDNYPYIICGSWEQKISCDLSELIDLYEQLQQMPELQEAKRKQEARKNKKGNKYE